MQKSLSNFLLAGMFLLVPACADRYLIAPLSPTPTANTSENLLTKNELYFGLSKPDGGTISEAQWQLFLSRTITPSFPEGLTVVDAYGQYLNKQGKLNKEKTKIVILIYQNTPAKERSIEEIIASYKRTFRQESVLRVTSSVTAYF